MGKPSAVDDEFRPDIEGLRGVAVVAVVLFHVRIARFSGGFVGVDVFFVLSGFLITRLLLREVARTGSISLPRFWARRARRLLPASCVVVVATVVAAQWLLSPIDQRPLATDAVAAGGSSSTSSSRPGSATTSRHNSADAVPLLHFWSLAVEEQFYLVLAADAAGLASPAAPLPPAWSPSTMIVVAVGSFVACVWMTRTHPTGAFYLLPAQDVGAHHRGSGCRRRLRHGALCHPPHGQSPGGSASPASLRQC